MNKKLALFPMTRDMCAIVRYPMLLREYALSHLLVPDYKRLEGIDISILDGGSQAGMVLSCYSKDKIAECDTLFVEYDEKLKDLSLYKEAINDAKELGKEVILSYMMTKKLETPCESWPEGLPALQSPENDRMYECSVPVIMVFSQGPNIDQFAIELALRKYFIEAGYKVGQIGSREVSRFFGFSGMPGFIYEQRNAYEIILKLNKYINDLEKAEEPELMIIGVPGGIMKYSNNILQGLGLLPFIVSNAVKSDVSILGMYHSIYIKDFFDNMCTFGQYRLGCPIKFFGVSNVSASIDARTNEIKMEYVDLDSDFVLQGIQDEMAFDEHYLFNVLDNESVKKACIAVHDVLVGNARYVH